MYKSILETLPHNQHYLTRYIRFIERRNKDTIKGDNHHICPKSKYMFPQYSNIKEHPWNVIKLTHREHFIAHWILSKVFTNIKHKSSMLKAFSRMRDRSRSHNDVYYNSRIYESARMANILAMTINNPMHNQTIKDRAKDNWKVFLLTEEGKTFKQNQSDRMKGVDFKSFFTESGMTNLRNRWLNIPRPKTQEHISNHKRSISDGIYKTPFGSFYTPNDASNSAKNVDKLSRYLIIKYCKNEVDGFSFIPKTQNQIH